MLIVAIQESGKLSAGASRAGGGSPPRPRPHQVQRTVGRNAQGSRGRHQTSPLAGDTTNKLTVSVEEAEAEAES